MSSTTMTMPADRRLSWKQAADDVHVATLDGEFAGFVAIHEQGHILHDAHGSTVGTYPTLAAARAALGSAASEASASPSSATKRRNRPFTYAGRRIRRALA